MEPRTTYKEFLALRYEEIEPFDWADHGVIDVKKCLPEEKKEAVKYLKPHACIKNLDRVVKDLELFENWSDFQGNTILHLALKKKEQKTFIQLIIALFPQFLERTNFAKMTPLMLMAASGKVKLLYWLEKFHAKPLNIHATNEDGLTALHFAASKGQKLFIDRLLQYQASKDCEDCLTLCPGEWALYRMSRYPKDSPSYQHYLEISKILQPIRMYKKISEIILVMKEGLSQDFIERDWEKPYQNHKKLKKAIIL